MAASGMDPPSKLSTSIIPQLEAVLTQLDGDAQGAQRKVRKTALKLARAIYLKLESPMDLILRMSWEDPAFNAALKVALDSGVFKILAKNQPKFVSIDEIASEIGAEPNLIRRILRHLAAMGAIREDEKVPDSYAATKLSLELTKGEVNSGVDYWFDVATPYASNMPAYLEKTGYKDPKDQNDGIWQYARQTKLNFFQWMSENPREFTSFSNHMAGYTSDRGSWLDVYPVERLLEGAMPGEALFVDVGGSMGHDAEKLRQRCPNPPGKIVVQDLPLVVEEARKNINDGIKLMAHDFFTPQPVKGKALSRYPMIQISSNVNLGARAYFMHSVLHDWSDERAMRIVGELKEAMRSGHSKLLINEMVVPATGASSIGTAMDLILMGVFSARERSQADWEKLLKDAGFRITGIFSDPMSAYESVIEVEPV